jgi:hypothetical protein
MAKKEKEPPKRLGLKNFLDFALNHGFCIDVASYDIYLVIKKTKHKTYRSYHEAVRASHKDKKGRDVEGWLVNLTKREKDFKPDGCGYKVIKIK